MRHRGKQRQQGGRGARAAAGAPGAAARLPAAAIAATAAAAVAAVALWLRFSALGGSSADVEAIERLIALGDAYAQFGSPEAPAPVARLRWSPDEPLAPWLSRLRVPAAFNSTEIDRWAARQSWSLAFLETALPKTVTCDVSHESGQMTYRDESAWREGKSGPAAGVGQEAIGMQTYDIERMPRKRFLRAIEQGRPWVRYGGDMRKWGPKLSADVAGWERLLVESPRALEALVSAEDGVLLPREEQLRSQLNIWVGSENITTTAHFDPQDNLFVQLEGWKRFTISPPSDFSLFDPFPISHPHTRQTQVHFHSSEPLPDSVRVLSIDLGPGEALFLPAGWVHAVEALTPTISVSVVAPTAEVALFDNLQNAGPLWTMPFVEGDGWPIARVVTAFSVFIPGLLRELAPRLGGFDAVEVVVQRMWSTKVRKELGLDCPYPCKMRRYDCGEITDDTRAAATRAIPIAARRFAPIRDETLPTFVTMYIELLHSHVKLPLGVLVLEQCLEGWPPEGT